MYYTLKKTLTAVTNLSHRETPPGLLSHL